jgi:hypothetical protein
MSPDARHGSVAEILGLLNWTVGHPEQDRCLDVGERLVIRIRPLVLVARHSERVKSQCRRAMRERRKAKKFRNA